LKDFANRIRRRYSEQIWIAHSPGISPLLDRRRGERLHGAGGTAGAISLRLNESGGGFT
jgi:hypothetical protein